jgi:hypothetical protein
MQAAFGIHVFGRGFGETIVLEFPNGGVGLIDCFSPQLSIPDGQTRLSVNPVLRFLKNELRAESLAFVGLTHPHEDHGRGLSHVLEEYRGRIGQIWMFQGFQSLYLERLLDALRASKIQLPIEELLNEDPGTFAFEIATIREEVLDQIDPQKTNRAKFRSFQGYKQFWIPDEPVSCEFLGPSDGHAAAYEANLIDSLATAFDPSGQYIVPDWAPDSINHNLISSALLLTYGQTRVLLGGDMELDAWSEALLEQQGSKKTNRSFSCHLIKAAHHGSVTGFHSDLAEQLPIDGRPPIAVLTPFNRHRNPLPTAVGITQLLPHVSELLVTNVEEVRRSVHRSIASRKSADLEDSVPSSSRIPLSWWEDIRSRPELLGTLNPRVMETLPESTLPAPVAYIPLRWYQDITANLSLRRLLAPKLNADSTRNDSTLELETDCRVSLYFNDSGEELRQYRYVGSAAGSWVASPDSSETRG